ncbi:MAG: hypothetical protein JNM24_15665 [Bdellovibrionaceae bacterium]|jgi:hypothetical protein|nr:hypothetical protein [Pseudobdellovibrionaceae bacterium]
MMKFKVYFSLLFMAAIGFSQTLERPPQFVLISFDGSKSHNFWRETFRLSDEADAQFTYFISGVYFLQKKDKLSYQPPKRKAGASDIGFADNDLMDIQKRTEFIWHGMNELKHPVEIGSHVNGHFDGSYWNLEEWTQEFNEFHRLVERVFSFYPTLNTRFANQWEYKLHGMIKGFRAPLLAGQVSITGQVLKDFQYSYDASQVLKGKWPYKHTPDLWNVGLSRIALAGTKRETVAMDYNILYGQCNGVFNPKDSGECKEIDGTLLDYYEKQTHMSYIQAFLKNYYGNRMPLSIGHHFSLWNKGIYWKALQRFVRDVCQLPEVRCVSHAQLVDWMGALNRTHGYSIFNKLNQGLFDKTDISQVPRERLKVDLSLLKKVSIQSQIYIPEISKTVEKVMLKGDLPHAHDEAPSDVDMEAFRYVPEVN